jgi:hypothetical protein
MLVGLLGKNAILIVEFAVQRRREGVSLKEAAVEGAKLRFRPIQMTSFAFIAGLLPLVVATGPGAIGNRTIGTAAAGGMLVGTVIGILVIPGLYYLFGKIADERHLVRDESDEPLTEIFEHRPLEPPNDNDDGLPLPAAAALLYPQPPLPDPAPPLRRRFAFWGKTGELGKEASSSDTHEAMGVLGKWRARQRFRFAPGKPRHNPMQHGTRKTEKPLPEDLNEMNSSENSPQEG